jgi:D-alanine transaminase
MRAAPAVASHRAQALNMTLAYLNGAFLPIEQAHVSVLDRGFIFGDGVYEVVPAFAGRMFRLEPHLARLENSLRMVRIDNPLDRVQWAGVLNTLVERNGGGDQSVYLQVTRGVAKRDHVLTVPVRPTVFAMSNPMTRKGRRTVSAITHPDIRWQWCHIKSTSLLPAVLLRMTATDASAYEAILLRDGMLTEGAATNVFVVKEGVVRTPPLGNLLLPGISREVIIELLVRHAIPHAETPVSEVELHNADEIWLSGSVSELAAVVELDGCKVGSGEPGQVYGQVLQLYERYRDAEVANLSDAAPA